MQTEIFERMEHRNKTTNNSFPKSTYTIIKPQQNTSFELELRNCVEQIKDLSEKNISIFRINIFSKTYSETDFNKQLASVEKTLNDAFGQKKPPYSLIMEEPCENFAVICEVGYINHNKQTQVTYGTAANIPYCKIETSDYCEFWLTGSHAISQSESIENDSIQAFDKLQNAFDTLKIDFNNIVRQWNYVGNILNKVLHKNVYRQHYQMFNETRSDYYGKFRQTTFFPAATGIGMTNNGVSIDCMAIKNNNKEVQIIPLSNPGQRESYEYKQEVLVGAPAENRSQNQAPQFERAMLLCHNDKAKIYISGTASIIGQKTVGIDDIEEQTRITIDNINKLVAPENIKKHYPAIKYIPQTYSYIRVYIKNKTDYRKVKDICSQIYGNTPATYIVADICRDNLLVEIEAEMQ